MQRLQRPRRRDASRWRRWRIEYPGRERNCVQGCPQIVRDESEILIAPTLQFECLLRREGLHGETDRFVEHAVQDVECLTLDGDPLALRQVVYAATQDGVFGDHPDHVETGLVSLHPVGRRTALEEGLRNRLVADRAQRL